MSLVICLSVTKICANPCAIPKQKLKYLGRILAIPGYAQAWLFMLPSHAFFPGRDYLPNIASQ